MYVAAPCERSGVPWLPWRWGRSGGCPSAATREPSGRRCAWGSQAAHQKLVASWESQQGHRGCLLKTLLNEASMYMMQGSINFRSWDSSRRSCLYGCHVHGTATRRMLISQDAVAGQAVAARVDREALQLMAAETMLGPMAEWQSGAAAA